MRMKTVFGLVLAGACIGGLQGCKDANDGVPAVKDYQHPLDANGKPISPADFYKQYCQGKVGNDTCAKILSVVQTSNTRGTYPKGW